MQRKMFRLLAMLFASSLMATAQNHYTSTNNYSIVDNTLNCYTNNCFLPVNGTAGGGTGARFTQISSGSDLTTLGVDLNGAIWQLPSSALGSKSVWSQTGLNNVNGTVYSAAWVAVLSATEIYAGFWTTCPGPTPQVFRWDGTTWYNEGGCLSTGSITSDDTLIGVNAYGGLWYTTNPTNASPTWVTLGGGWSNAVGINSATAVGLQGNQLYNINLSAGTSSVWSGTSPVQSFAYTQDAKLYIVTTGNVVYGFDYTNPGWQQYTGTVSKVFGGSSMGLFALDSSNLPYHFLGIAQQASASISGYYQINLPTAVHTAKVTTQFPHSYFTNHTQSASGPPTANLSVTVNDVSSECDPLFGDPSSPECFIGASSGGTVTCSMMGPILANVIWPKYEIELATTLLKMTSIQVPPDGVCETNLGVTECSYDAVNWCTARTSPPDLNPPNGVRRVAPATYPTYWKVFGLCERPGPGVAWWCLPPGGAASAGAKLPDNYPLVDCTHNP